MILLLVGTNFPTAAHAVGELVTGSLYAPSGSEAVCMVTNEWAKPTGNPRQHQIHNVRLRLCGSDGGSSTTCLCESDGASSPTCIDPGTPFSLRATATRQISHTVPGGSSPILYHCEMRYSATQHTRTVLLIRSSDTARNAQCSDVNVPDKCCTGNHAGTCMKTVASAATRPEDGQASPGDRPREDP